MLTKRVAMCSINKTYNKLGLVNVLPKGIYILSESNKRIVQTENVYPEGGVSKELLKSQMQDVPAKRLLQRLSLLNHYTFFGVFFDQDSIIHI